MRASRTRRRSRRVAGGRPGRRRQIPDRCPGADRNRSVAGRVPGFRLPGLVRGYREVIEEVRTRGGDVMSVSRSSRPLRGCSARSSPHGSRWTSSGGPPVRRATWSTHRTRSRGEPADTGAVAAATPPGAATGPAPMSSAEGSPPDTVRH
ncbi:hypothetical protein HBB16_19485 [Pseudonocardia sp. MCCB 268]|nr:hypothetical protein [Pseudonocardia cytotoxica]